MHLVKLFQVLQFPKRLLHNFLGDRDTSKQRVLKILVLGLLLSFACELGIVEKGISNPVINSQVLSKAFPINQMTTPPKVVFFGSSTTVGLWASRGDRRWSTLLSRYMGWQEINESLSGSTLSKASRDGKPLRTTAAVQRWREAITPRHPDLVVMLYGVNDAYWKLPLGDEVNPKPATFRGDLETMLTGMAQVLRPDRLVVVTPQPNQATRDRRSPYDLALKEGANKIGANFIDAGQEAFPIDELSNYSADGLHLNNLGHAALASYIAGKLIDIGVVTPPPMAKGGNNIPEAREALSGGFLRIDVDRPLSFGVIRSISARWLTSGQARFALMRPDGRGGYELIYRTPKFAVSKDITETKVPRWWVLEGDRLAVWTDGNCLGSQSTETTAIHHLAIEIKQDMSISDVKSSSIRADDHKLAIWTS
ncbi:SGNH/GDSL hydrolase family protein [Pseudanabaena sp. UWO311]|uniref:SGNH/GDSL hydrolase family protein n=1 Tax=Pseudanabaena sp. UWO311 TaxID=2487337 RepID=UPI001156C883|nr:SGNH/GDSL hydrolase family protein [Pseudanabaena sp. UWO311]TYQ25216.1 SGNH/GDSL hydrolase family protein [Pseudanabaena sp. UWO311]